MIEQTLIPADELEQFKRLSKIGDFKVIFDVGARIDIDYLQICPDAEFHLFEPNPEFFEELTKRVDGAKNVKLNNFGLSDKTGEFPYDGARQSFMNAAEENQKFMVQDLDKYVEDNKITKIDFLKIDTEGWDVNVLRGGRRAIAMTRYIQYEHWDDKLCFHDILEGEFIMCYTGYRNVLCIRKGEPWL